MADATVFAGSDRDPQCRYVAASAVGVWFVWAAMRALLSVAGWGDMVFSATDVTYSYEFCVDAAKQLDFYVSD